MNGRKFVREIYYFEMAVQSFINLALPIGVFALLSWFFVEKKGAPTWLYVPLIVFGTAIGLFSMVKFLIRASAQIDALRKQHEEKSKSEERKNS